ncbi:MAG: reverse transcriptase-like protein [Candidatus Saccharibacteria bacterium]|nr:reverse transcriptase-like protein [Candidatus Saccharibacteria bacterium]
MKQRIRVTAICRRDDEVLLLKRAGGRIEGGTPNFELPQGKIIFGEQPEEAMIRVIYENLGAQATSIQLTDAVTFTNLEGASELGNLYIVYEVKVDDKSVKITNERYSAYKWVKVADVETFPLENASLMVLQIVATKTGTPSTRIMQVGEGAQVLPANDFATIYTDGGSRGNPGPSGLGYYIIGADGKEIKRGGEFLGFSSSRLAEYYGLKEGLEQAIELGLKKVHFKSDSLMMVNQMNGVYKVKNQDLLQVHADVLKLLENLEAYSFTHVPRGQNVEADAEVNKVIDANVRRGEY